MCNNLACYAAGLRRRGVKLVCMQEGFPFNGDLQDCLRLCPEPPSLILQPEADVPYLPWGLANVNIPTACFQVDTYSYLRHRIRWSMLFDEAIVFHPGYDRLFQRAGHPGAWVFLHAVRAELFQGEELERAFEVGWVGQVQGSIYRTRLEILPALSQTFRMNDVARRYSLEEMAQVYRQSRIVVNIGRDDYPQDANMRTFEAMAAGALLITLVPSELTQIGFTEGVHFVGYRNALEIAPLVRNYLNDEASRQRIADAGRAKVLGEHTYDVRIEEWLRRIAQDRGKLLAPARQWPVGRVRRIYLDYFAANDALSEAAAELRKIARHSPKETVLGAALLSRAWSKRLANKLRSRKLAA